MNRYITIPLLLSIIWLVLSFFTMVNLFLLFSLLEVLWWVSEKIGVEDDLAYLDFGSVFYGILTMLMLLFYLKTHKRWQEVMLGISYFCFATAALFPFMLKLLSTVEPPYTLDFIVITIIAGLIVTTAGLIKFKTNI
jgi:hypothetical protein